MHGRDGTEERRAGMEERERDYSRGPRPRRDHPTLLGARQWNRAKGTWRQLQKTTAFWDETDNREDSEREGRGARDGEAVVASLRRRRELPRAIAKAVGPMADERAKRDNEEEDSST